MDDTKKNQRRSGSPIRPAPAPSKTESEPPSEWFRQNHRYCLRVLEVLQEINSDLRTSSSPASLNALKLVHPAVDYVFTGIHSIPQQESRAATAATAESRSLARMRTTLGELRALLDSRLEEALGERCSPVELKPFLQRFIDLAQVTLSAQEHLQIQGRQMVASNRADPLFETPRAAQYEALYRHLTERVIAVGTSGSSLNLIHGASAVVEHLEVLSSGLRRLRSEVGDQAILGLGRYRELLKGRTGPQPPAESLKNHLQQNRDAVSALKELSVTTAKSLLNPRLARRILRPSLPPRVADTREDLTIDSDLGLSHSWQAQAVTLGLRLWLKRMMRHGEFARMHRLTALLNRYGPQLPKSCTVAAAGIAALEAEWITDRTVIPSRVLLYLPGGAFLFPASPLQRNLAARIATAIEARTLMVHYRLAPQYPFPACLDDCVTAYQFLIKTGIEPSRIVIAGDSAGGCLTLTTLLALRDSGTPLPGAAVVLSPLTDLTYSGSSRVFNRWRDPMLPSERASLLNEVFLRDTPADDPRVSPLFGEYRGLPPILAQVGSTEILLDDTLRFAARARGQGVSVDVEVWREMPHVWQTLLALPESAWAVEHIAKFVRRQLPDSRSPPATDNAVPR